MDSSERECARSARETTERFGRIGVLNASPPEDMKSYVEVKTGTLDAATAALIGASGAELDVPLVVKQRVWEEDWVVATGSGRPLFTFWAGFTLWFSNAPSRFDRRLSYAGFGAAFEYHGVYRTSEPVPISALLIDSTPELITKLPAIGGHLFAECQSYRDERYGSNSHYEGRHFDRIDMEHTTVALDFAEISFRGCRGG